VGTAWPPAGEEEAEQGVQSAATALCQGGSGTTTLAVHLAVAAAQAGARVVLLDTDPQGSARAWAQVRSQPLVLGVTPAALPQQLATLDATLVVLATAPHTAVLLPAVAAVATALLLPWRPTAFALAAVPATVALAGSTTCCTSAPGAYRPRRGRPESVQRRIPHSSAYFRRNQRMSAEVLLVCHHVLLRHRHTPIPPGLCCVH